MLIFKYIFSQNSFSILLTQGILFFCNRLKLQLPYFLLIENVEKFEIGDTNSDILINNL